MELTNPHLSAYKMDDELDYTCCPHCGTEDGFHREFRCPVCHLWPEDESEAKIARLVTIVKGLDDEALGHVFEAAIEEII